MMMIIILFFFFLLREMMILCHSRMKREIIVNSILVRSQL